MAPSIIFFDQFDAIAPTRGAREWVLASRRCCFPRSSVYFFSSFLCCYLFSVVVVVFLGCICRNGKSEKRFSVFYFGCSLFWGLVFCLVGRFVLSVYFSYLLRLVSILRSGSSDRIVNQLLVLLDGYDKTCA